MRPTRPKALRFPKLGELRVRESTRWLRRMLEAGRFHVYAAAFRFANGRWTVAVTGVAAALHPSRRSPTGRHRPRVGVDLGVKTLAVAADETGTLRHEWKGVKALQQAQGRLKLANQALARTKRGSNGRRTAARRLGKIHARTAALRTALLHEISTTLARGCTSVVIEDLNAAGMLANRRLARVVSDAAFGELRRQLTYKTGWYGTELVVADRWFPSSKTCSGCGTVKTELTLTERTYACPACGLELDRDLNAAINLARYQPKDTEHAPPLPAAA